MSEIDLDVLKSNLDRIKAEKNRPDPNELLADLFGKQPQVGVDVVTDEDIPAIGSFQQASADPSMVQERVAPVFASERAAGLLRDLGGRIPITDEDYAALKQKTEQQDPSVRFRSLMTGTPTQEEKAALIESPLLAQENARRSAYQELIGMGATPEDITAALAFQKGTQEPSPIPRAAGGIGGSIAATAVLGRAIPGPVDDIGIMMALLKAGGQAAGAGGGAVAGRAIQAAADPDDETNKEELLKIFGTEAATELAAIGLGRYMQRTFRGGIRGGVEDSRELSEFLTKKVKEAVPTRRTPVGLLPGQVAPDQPAAKGIDSIVSKGLFSQRDDAQFRILQKMGALKAGDTILDDFLPGVESLNPEESFLVLSDIVANRRKVPELMAKKLFDKVDDIIADSTAMKTVTKNVPTSILDDTGKPILRQVTEQVESPPMVNIAKIQNRLRDELDIIEDAIGPDNQKFNLIKSALSKDSMRTFGQTQEDITNLGEIVRASGDLFTKNPRLKRAASIIKKGLEEARDEAFDQLPAEAKKIAQRARTIWSAKSARYDNPVLVKLFNNLEQDPVALERFMAGQKLPNIKLLKKQIGDKAFDRVRKGWAKGVIKKAGTTDAGIGTDGKGLLMGDSIVKSLNENEDVARYLLGNKEFEQMRKTGRVISLIQKQDTQGVAAFRMLQLGSALALVGAGSGAERLGGREGAETAGLALAGTILLGPKVLGKLSRRPEFTELLTKGMNVGPTTKEAVQIGSRLVRMVNQERKNVAKEEKALRAGALTERALELGARDE